ncbi:hypothetical protein HK100_002989 [Physocladia obscura]|uniref:Ubiquinone biosynthesis protein COQ7 n=1 Tax=Physocladia obscura TaxID=109957 RepID=A0AAD5SUL0_9FUNG|nr:hypothetical protein HK100_002989 [Physocladia obscura]
MQKAIIQSSRRLFTTNVTQSSSTQTVSNAQLGAIKAMLRVNQAGELAADAIYKGQLAVLPKTATMRPVIEHMWQQEKHHLQILDTLVANNRVRPSIFSPVWYSLGFALGAGTALLVR